MADIKRVVTTLENCPCIPFVLCFAECTNSDCKYRSESGIERLHEDAIALLKEQEEEIYKLQKELYYWQNKGKAVKWDD